MRGPLKEFLSVSNLSNFFNESLFFFKGRRSSKVEGVVGDGGSPFPRSRVSFGPLDSEKASTLGKQIVEMVATGRSEVASPAAGGVRRRGG